MRKALLPLVASLALCGAATVALIATNARAEQTPQRPVMLAQLTPGQTAAPAQEDGPPAGMPPGMPPDMRDRMMDRGERRGQFCKDMYAHKVGELAFLEAKLSLNATQEPLFDRWKQVTLDVAKRHEGDCAGHERRAADGERRNVVDHLAREEDMLKKRLADIQTERPALAAFYDSLNPTQKQEFGRAAMHPMAERMHMMGMMGRPHMGMDRGMDRMGPPPMGMDHGPMGEAPPPPPAQ